RRIRIRTRERSCRRARTLRRTRTESAFQTTRQQQGVHAGGRDEWRLPRRREAHAAADGRRRTDHAVQRAHVDYDLVSPCIEQSRGWTKRYRVSARFDFAGRAASSIALLSDELASRHCPGPNDETVDHSASCTPPVVSFTAFRLDVDFI